MANEIKNPEIKGIGCKHSIMAVVALAFFGVEIWFWCFGGNAHCQEFFERFQKNRKCKGDSQARFFSHRLIMNSGLISIK